MIQFFHDLTGQKLLFICASTQKHMTNNLTWMLVWRNKILRVKIGNLYYQYKENN